MFSICDEQPTSKSGESSSSLGLVCGKRHVEFAFTQFASQNSDACSEFDIFLEDPRILVMSNENFNVLAWWKNNSNAYPVLSLMARDILAIPVSTHTCPQNLHLVLLEEFFVKIGLHTPQKTLKP